MSLRLIISDAYVTSEDTVALEYLQGQMMLDRCGKTLLLSETIFNKLEMSLVLLLHLFFRVVWIDWDQVVN